MNSGGTTATGRGSLGFDFGRSVIPGVEFELAKVTGVIGFACLIGCGDHTLPMCTVLSDVNCVLVESEGRL